MASSSTMSVTPDLVPESATAFHTAPSSPLLDSTSSDSQSSVPQLELVPVALASGITAPSDTAFSFSPHGSASSDIHANLPTPGVGESEPASGSPLQQDSRPPPEADIIHRWEQLKGWAIRSASKAINAMLIIIFTILLLRLALWTSRKDYHLYCEQQDVSVCQSRKPRADSVLRKRY